MPLSNLLPSNYFLFSFHNKNNNQFINNNNRAFARIGASYHKMGDLEKAIDSYKTSLTENRVRDVQLTLKKLETEKEEKDKLSYLSPEIAQQEKEKGNQFFKESKFPEAIAAYSEGIIYLLM